MATTRKSTQAKTKIQPKRTARTASVQAKKPTSRAVRSIRPVKQSQASRATTGSSRVRNPLQQLYLISGVIFLGLAVVAGVLMNTTGYQLVTGLLTKDELASQTNTVFVSAVHALYDVELRWVVVGILGLSAIFSLLLATRLQRGNQASVATTSRFWRWVDTAIISGLMVEVVALLSGVQDIVTLKLMGGMVVVSCLLAWIAEKEHVENNRPARAAFWLSMLAGLLPWLGIGMVASSTYVYGMLRTSWFVYALYASTLAGAVATAVLLRRRLMSPVTDVKSRSDQSLSWVNLLARAAFAIILIVGLRK